MDGETMQKNLDEILNGSPVTSVEGRNNDFEITKDVRDTCSTATVRREYNTRAKSVLKCTGIAGYCYTDYTGKAPHYRDPFWWEATHECPSIIMFMSMCISVSLWHSPFVCGCHNSQSSSVNCSCHEAQWSPETCHINRPGSSGGVGL